MKSNLLVFIVGLMLFAQCSHEKHESEHETTFLATYPKRVDTLITRDYVGQIHSFQHIELRALEKGYLQKIFVDEGQKVVKGQLLFQITPVIYQAEKQKAEAELKFAEIEYKNTKSLSDSHIVSKNELALAKAKLEKEKAQLALSQAHLNFTEIRAPFDGIVGRFKDVRLGSLVDEGDLLTTLSDNRKMWVYFNVPESEYLDFALSNRSQSQKKVQLQLANGQLFEEDGIIETIEADFNNETGNIAFRATFQNAEGILRNGETGNVKVSLPLKNALLIPQKCTFEILDKKFVYVVDSSQTIAAREIKIGAEMPHFYSVSQGLSSSDRVLVDGLRKVKAGQKVKAKLVDFRAIQQEVNHLHAE